MTNKELIDNFNNAASGGAKVLLSSSLLLGKRIEDKADEIDGNMEYIKSAYMEKHGEVCQIDLFFRQTYEDMGEEDGEENTGSGDIFEFERKFNETVTRYGKENVNYDNTPYSMSLVIGISMPDNVKDNTLIIQNPFFWNITEQEHKLSLLCFIEDIFFSDDETEEIIQGNDETEYLSSVPDMTESIQEGTKTPVEECVPEEDVEY